MTEPNYLQQARDDLFGKNQIPILSKEGAPWNGLLVDKIEDLHPCGFSASTLQAGRKAWSVAWELYFKIESVKVEGEDFYFYLDTIFGDNNPKHWEYMIKDWAKEYIESKPDEL